MKLIAIAITFMALQAFSQRRSLEAQVEITRSTIKRITLDISNQSRGASLNVPDFDQWEGEFQDEVEEKLIQFENKFSNDVVGVLEKLTSKYQAIYNDENILDEQKEMLLRSIDQTFEMVSDQVQEEYEKIITDLYDFSKYLPVDYEFISLGRREGLATVRLAPIFEDGVIKDKFLSMPIKKYEIANCKKSKINLLVKPSSLGKWRLLETPPSVSSCEETFEINKNPQLYKVGVVNEVGDYDVVFSKIIEGCSTKACIILKKATLMHYLNLINSDLNKGFKIVLNEGSPRQKVLEFSKKNIQTNLFIGKLLKRDDFSEYVNNLPFDNN